MKKTQIKSILISIGISAIFSVVIFIWWIFGESIDSFRESLASKVGIPVILQIFFLLMSGAVVTVIAEKNSIKKLLPFVSGFLLVLFVLNLITVNFFSVSLLFLPIAMVTLLTLFIVHAKRLWLIDSKLTQKLENLGSSGHLLEGTSADSRIESGFRLLETVLPLSEAIVFHFDKKGNLSPVGRSRHNNSFDSSISRQSEWRKTVEICEQVVTTRKTVINLENPQTGKANIALPLINVGNMVGVLLVKVAQNFEDDDRFLLEAFSEQLARNFQRKELSTKDLPHKSFWGSISTQSAENRLEITDLIHGLMKEQSFAVLANSQLKEAHAIAYLDGTLAYLNSQMRHLISLSPAEINRLDLLSLLDGFRTEIFNEPRLAVRRVLQTGEEFQGELNFTESNKILNLRISLVKAPLDEESIHDSRVPTKPACFLISVRDITAIKENEKLRSDMASLMSHELRTPITSIKGFSELLLNDKNIPAESREFLSIISNEAQRLSNMLTTFLSVSNLQQSDKQEFQKTPVKLDIVVNEVVKQMRDVAMQKRIRLVEQTATQIPPVAADKGLIMKAVGHLVDNAIRYSPERTSVIVSTILESDFLRVTVEDRGYGIPVSEQEKVWQKFYRVEREGKQEETTGLGLSLVKEIVEKHGGEVELQSEVGYGSKFSLKLPRL